MGVRRRAYIAAVMMAATLALGAATSPAIGRLASSTHSFRQYFRDLKKSPMSTVERVVFSLVLANAKTPRPEPGSELPAGRT